MLNHHHIFRDRSWRTCRILRSLVCIAVLLASGRAPAQGTAFSYQGQLFDGTNPANGIYDVQFKLFASGAAGLPSAGPVTNSAVWVTNGLFETTVDFGGGVYNGANYWLELAVRTNGGYYFTTLAPRQNLTPAPYSVYAATAGAVAAGGIVGTVPLTHLPTAVIAAAQAATSGSLAYSETVAAATAASPGATAVINANYAAFQSALYSNTPYLSEHFTNLAAWASTNVQVSGNQLYCASPGGNPAGANYHFPLPANGGLARVVTTINVPATGVSNTYAFAGWDTQPGNAPPPLSGVTDFGVGIAGGPNFTTVNYAPSNGEWSSSSPFSPSWYQPGIPASATYLVDQSADENEFSWVIQYPGHTNEYRVQYPRSGLPPVGNLMLWDGDARQLKGVSFGPIAARPGPATIPDPSIDKQGDFVIWGQDGYGQSIRVTVPRNYDSVTNQGNLVVFCHGCCATDENFPYDGQSWGGTNGFPERGFFQTLIDNNYIVASSAEHGLQSWGDPDSVADVYHLIQWVRTKYAVSNIFIIGASMGGLVSLNFIASHQVQVAGYVSLYAVASLSAQLTNGFCQDIYQAYGTTNPVTLLSRDPANNPASRLNYFGVPMQFYASPGDGAVHKECHADVMTNLLAGLSPELDEIVCSGVHCDPSHYQASNVLAFFQRCMTYKPVTVAPDAAYASLAAASAVSPGGALTNYPAITNTFSTVTAGTNVAVTVTVNADGSKNLRLDGLSTAGLQSLLQSVATLTNNLVLPPSTICPLVIANGASGFWNSNGITWLRTSAPGSTNVTDHLLSLQ